MNQKGESGFWQLAQMFVDVVLLGVLWLLTSLPILTIGASTYALHAVMSEYVAGDTLRVAKRYFARFRGNFWKATKLWLLHLAAFAILVLDLLYYWYGESRLDTLSFVAIATVATLLALEFNLCFVCLSQKPEGKVFATIGFAFDLAMTCFGRALLLIVLSVGLPAALIYLLPESIILVPGLCCRLCWQLLPDMLQKYRFKKNARDRLREEKRGKRAG